MVAPWIVAAAVLIGGGILIDSLNKGRLSVPVMDELIGAAGSTAAAIETFAQLFALVMRPAFDAEGRLSKSKAFQIWASTPALQLASVLAIGAPVGAAACLSTPRLIEAVPNAMKTLSEIETPSLTLKQKKNLKLAIMGTTAISGFWAFEQFNLWRYLQLAQPTQQEQLLLEARTLAKEKEAGSTAVYSP